MAQFIHSELIKVAVGRLSESRASKSMLNFLVFKRASARAHESVVSFSNSNENLGNAVEDVYKRQVLRLRPRFSCKAA